MSLSTNINNYSDVAEVLATALPSGKASYELETPGLAQHWMMRAYKYRLLLQKQIAMQQGVKGFAPPTPYDKMKLRRVGSAIEMDFHPTPKGKLTLSSGETVTPEAIKPVAPSTPPAPTPLRIKPASLSDLEWAAEALLREHDEP